MPARSTRAILAILLLGGVAGCTQPLYCPDGDWRRVGARDALAGKPSGYISTYAEVCAKAGITPDAGAWAAGHREGMAAYCTERNAYRLGYYRGYFNPGVCPPEDRRRLSNANHQGNVRRMMEEDLREELWRGGGRFIPRP